MSNSELYVVLCAYSNTVLKHWIDAIANGSRSLCENHVQLRASSFFSLPLVSGEKYHFLFVFLNTFSYILLILSSILFKYIYFILLFYLNIIFFICSLSLLILLLWGEERKSLFNVGRELQ